MTSVPAFHVSSQSKVQGRGQVFIASRQDSASTGVFTVAVDVHFDPIADAYPTGSVRIAVNMSDSLKGTFASTSVELVNSHGKHNPTVFFAGRCKASNERAPKGLRYWVMIADNASEGRDGATDIVGFVIHDRKGNRVAYGTGPLKSGSIRVEPN